MKLTINNYDGNGAVDYTSSIVAGRPFRIVRRINEPVTCEVTLLPASGLAMPARNGRVTVCDDSGNLLFTGYVATEPALELAGQSSTGAAYVALVNAISDDILLNRQSLPQSGASYGLTAGQSLQALLARVQIAGILQSLSQATQILPSFQLDPGRTWAENTGALANAVRNAWRLMDGTLIMTPVGSVTHTLSEAQGTLSLSDLDLSMAKSLANDITVCGAAEPSAYVTEYFQGDGTTVLFDLTEQPYLEPTSKEKPLVDTFSGPTVNPQLWALSDPSANVSITANGLTCAGGNGQLGITTLTAISNLELGGSITIELGGVQFGAQTAGILNGLYGGGGPTLPWCLLGFQIAQSSGAVTIAPVVNGANAGTTFTAASGHLYTLRLRFYANELQRILQAYYAVGAQGATQLFGSAYVNSAASAVLELQDTTGGVAGANVVLWSGAVPLVPPYCQFIPLNASYLQCSIGSVTVEQQGPLWVTSTPPSGTATVLRLGTPAQGADCTVERTGRLRFYSASTPVAGAQIAICYRTTRRSVARMASAASITTESMGGQLPGTACWMGSVTNPVPRSSADCENAASAMLLVSTSRAAAWSGKYTLWNPTLGSTGSDIWPGDVLAVSSASAGVTADLVVRTVEIDLASTVPSMMKYTVAFANDWADDLAITTSSSVPADAWLPLAPETAPPLANLNTLAITSVTGSAITIAAGVTPPTGGGFEVRRRDWSFTAGPGPDLVLRSPVPNFSIPRAAAQEQYYIRMYDASTPPNYSRFSTAVFVNLPLTT
ncbi:MAG TPA: hypothetical protein VMD25_03040 [Acidobacteriaceae bacterium]|nr:hypothetical protein [Acidobacteriaceae bacterium]